MKPQWLLLRLIRKGLYGYSYLIILFCVSSLSNLFGQGTGLVGYYYSNDGPDYKFTAPLTIKRIDPKIDFNWGGGSPVPGLVNPESFSIRWVGKIEPKVSGNHTFFLRADDGVRLKVNGQSLIDDWRLTWAVTRESTIDLFLVM